MSSGIFERFRGILHEGEIDKRVQFMIEGLFAVRKARFQVTLEVAHILLVQSFNAQLLRCCRWLYNELSIIYCVCVLQDQSHYKQTCWPIEFVHDCKVTCKLFNQV